MGKGEFVMRKLKRHRRSGRPAHFGSGWPYRLARTVELAGEYLGDAERARRWLKRPNRTLGGIAPADAMDTELRARTLENLLGRIAYGGIS